MNKDKHTPKSESFGNFVQRHLDSDQSETIATLRAEKAELIEALRSITQIKAARMSIGRALHEATSIAYKTLAKYETK
jgi:hypothetical protein